VPKLTTEILARIDQAMAPAAAAMRD